MTFCVVKKPIIAYVPLIVTSFLSLILLIPTQDKDGFVSKWFYKFLPSQKLVHLSGYSKHHRGGGQLPKNMYEIL